MYILVTTIKDENGILQDSWQAFETQAEAQTAYNSVLENPSLYSASIGGVIASTDYTVVETP